MSKFAVNEYVWDRVREGPAVIVQMPKEGEPYTVAEIIEYPTNHLGRLAHRGEADLCRYVKVLLPEDEAQDAARLLENPTAHRVAAAMEKRGIEWNP